MLRYVVTPGGGGGGGGGGGWGGVGVGMARTEVEDLVEVRDDDHAADGLGSRRADPRACRARRLRRGAPPPGRSAPAQYIAETYFETPSSGTPSAGCSATPAPGRASRSPCSDGMGCPTAAIVMEELVQLGVKRFIRVGTAAGLQPDLELGDMIVALTAVPADRTVDTYVDHEPHCPTASWELVHGAVHAAKEIGQQMRVGPIVSSDVFDNPDSGQYERWSSAASWPSRWRPPCCSRSARCATSTRRAPHRQRRRRRGRVPADQRRRAARGRRPDDARRARDRHGGPEIAAVFLVNPASDNGATGRRWPQLANAPPRAASPATRSSPNARSPDRARARGGRRRRGLLVVVGGDGSVNEVANGIAQRDVEIAVIARGTGWDFARSQRIPRRVDDAVDVALNGATREIDLGRVSYHSWAGADETRWFATSRASGMSARSRSARTRRRRRSAARSRTCRDAERVRALARRRRQRHGRRERAHRAHARRHRRQRPRISAAG